ncbi:hypothetical protein ACFL2Q_10395 [Thermodesulfobacteriota bacterium]
MSYAISITLLGLTSFSLLLLFMGLRALRLRAGHDATADFRPTAPSGTGFIVEVESIEQLPEAESRRTATER